MRQKQNSIASKKKTDSDSDVAEEEYFNSDAVLFKDDKAYLS